MIVAQFTSKDAVVRVHDECYERQNYAHTKERTRIVSESYRRREMQAENNNTKQPHQ